MNIQVSLRGKRVHVASKYSPILIDRFKTIPTREYHPEDRTWSFVAVKDILLMVTDVCGLVPEMLPADIKEILVSQGYQAPKQKPVDLSVLEGHTFLTAPYEHQRVGLARLLIEPRWLIADEQGCGKSHIIANRLRRFYGHQLDRTSVLIVCPKSVMSVWQDELRKHGNLPSRLVEGTASERASILRFWTGCPLIVNYDVIWRDLREFQRYDWDVLVIDEVHKAKNFTSMTGKALRKLSEGASFVWGLSGTPAPNGLEDWLGVLSVIKPDHLPVQTKTGFRDRYCLMGRLGGDGPAVVQGYRNVAELHQYVSAISSRVTKAEALDLPEKVFQVRRCVLDGDQKQVYRDLKKDAVARLTCLQAEGTLTVRNILTESLRLLQVVGGFVPDDTGRMFELGHKAKLAPLADALDEAGGEPVVIWCAFREEVDYLADWLLKEHYAQVGEVVMLTGATDLDDRRRNIERFQKGQARYFVGTAAAGGTGITLTAAATEVYYSRNYNLADYLQSIDRLHRIGQTRSVNVVKLIASGTIDGTVDEKLDQKADLQEMLLQKPEDYL